MERCGTFSAPITPPCILGSSLAAAGRAVPTPCTETKTGEVQPVYRKLAINCNDPGPNTEIMAR
jgi:hypothetical protein